MRGPLKQRERIEVHIVIPELSAHYQKSLDIAASDRSRGLRQRRAHPAALRFEGYGN